jgi:putative ABC transport system permease protein
MQLRDITVGSLLRRPTRAAFVVGALALGVGTLVAMVSLTQAMRTDLGDELDRFGANIVITPKSTVIDLAYGGATLGGVTVDGRDLQTTDAAKVPSPTPATSARWPRS